MSPLHFLGPPKINKQTNKQTSYNPRASSPEAPLTGLLVVWRSDDGTRYRLVKWNEPLLRLERLPLALIGPSISLILMSVSMWRMQDEEGNETVRQTDIDFFFSPNYKNIQTTNLSSSRQMLRHAMFMSVSMFTAATWSNAFPKKPHHTHNHSSETQKEIKVMTQKLRLFCSFSSSSFWIYTGQLANALSSVLGRVVFLPPGWLPESATKRSAIVPSRNN